MSPDTPKRTFLRPEMLPVLALALVAIVSTGMFAYRRYLESQKESLQGEREELEELAAMEELLTSGMAVRCPPVLELDPGWADRMPWGPGGEEALARLEGGAAEVRIFSAQGEPGPTVSWNPELRVYDLDAREAEERGAFYLGVRLEEDRWARTVPTNWPLPLCEPWVDCTGAPCEDGCLPATLPAGAEPAPAAVPEPCRR